MIHHDPNDRTAPRRCATCGLPFVPPRTGQISETCSGSRFDGSRVSRAERDRCRQARLRGDRVDVDARLLATFYGTGDPFAREIPSPVSLALLADEYGLSWCDYFGEYDVDVQDEEERADDDGLRPLVEERPLRLDPRSHKRRTGVEDAPEEVPDPDPEGKRSDAPPHRLARPARLPADLVQESGENGLPYLVRVLAKESPGRVGLDDGSATGPRLAGGCPTSRLLAGLRP